MVRDQQGQFTLTCPNCRLVTSIPPTGVAGLQSSFQVNSLLEIQTSLKEAPPLTSLQPECMCSEHPGEELKLYCQTCEELICLKCAIRNGGHHSHSYDDLTEALEKYKGEIVSSLGPIENQLSAIDKALKFLNKRCGEILTQNESINASIHDTFKQIHDFIDIRKAELISHLHKLAQDKLLKLTTQKETLETSQAQLNSCVDFMRQSLGSDSADEVMKRKSLISEQVRQLLDKFQPATLRPCTEADVKFSASPDIKAAIQAFGCVTGTNEPSISHGDGAVLEATASIEKSSLPDPSKCYLTGDYLEVAGVENTCTAVLHVANSDLQACSERVESITCALTSELHDMTEQCTIQQTEAGQYKISYRPTAKGRHQLHIKVNDQYIAKAPLSLSAVSPVGIIGRLLSTISDVKQPWGVAITRSGEIVVSEHESHTVLVFSPSGRKLRSIGSRGSREGQLLNPRGVAVDKDGAVIVADYKNNRVQKFSSSGRFIKSVGSKGSGPLQFKGPKGIAFSSFNSKLYVVDENHQVKILNSDLTYYGTFGKIGWGNGQLNDPWGVACDSTGKVYVADTTNNRVQVFAADGMYMSAVGKRGKGWGELVFPAGVAVDSNDRLYISERYNHRVSVFSSDGSFLTSFGSFGAGDKQFKYPRGVAVDSSGVVYVCDNNNNRVSMF